MSSRRHRHTLIEETSGEPIDRKAGDGGKREFRTSMKNAAPLENKSKSFMAQGAKNRIDGREFRRWADGRDRRICEPLPLDKRAPYVTHLTPEGPVIVSSECFQGPAILDRSRIIGNVWPVPCTTEEAT